MDRPRDYHIKGSKSDRKRPTSYYSPYMQNLKKKKKDTDVLIYRTEIDSQI